MANIVYNGSNYGDWIISTNDISQLWKAQPTYLISQAIYLFAGFVTFIHAMRKGGRWPYFWLGTVLHGIYADNFWHFILPEYDNFWHSIAPVMIFGSRLPLHIILLYPAFMYHAAYGISKLHLPKYSEPFAVGLLTVLIDLPYDIVAVKFVHWTWHDTDPNIFDRHYHVPWNSYYFHATFTASFYFFFTQIRNLYDSETPQWNSSSYRNELKALIIATLLGMPGGVLLFVPIYHPLHDMLKIHSEVTFFMLASIYMIFIFNGLLNRERKTDLELKFIDYILMLQLAIHYLAYWIFVMYFHPEKEVSTGLHEPVGPCNEMSSLVTPFGQTLKKRKFFCPTDYDERYFNFHCVNGSLPSNGEQWYTICGTPFENRSEYIVILSTILLVALGVFYGIYFGSKQQKYLENEKKNTQTRQTLTKLKPKNH